MMTLNILIIGGGIAGPALAFWLSQTGHHITIVERYPVLRANGAQIDLRDQGLQVARRMGLIDAIRSKVVNEDGLKLVDRTGRTQAALVANKTGKGAQSLSSEFEIMRGDLVRVLYDATKDDVKYIFGKTVERFEQDDKRVTAYFSDGTVETYDMIVGADGQGSRIRKAILPARADPLRHLGIFQAHWRVPTVETDDAFAKVSHLPGGRVIFTRTHSPVESQACFMLRDDSEELRSIPKASVEKQKEFWSEKFGDAGWVAPRLIDGIKDSDYFYCQEIVQVRTDTWYKGRVVLVADAAHCPSPMTGMGTTSALVGSYVLAGEILQNTEDLDKAFANYDRVLRPFVNEIQRLPGWVLPLITPKTQLGIKTLHWVMSLITFLRIPELLSRFMGEERGGWQLPEYPLLDEVVAKQG